MLRELDFVEGNWAALSWAIGSSTTLFRHSVSWKVRKYIEDSFGPDITVKNIAKKTMALLFGMFIAGGILTLCLGGLLRLVPMLFPALQSGNAPWMECLFLIAIPEISYLAAALMLWRRRRSVAEGIVLGGFTLAGHVILHVAIHGWTT